MKSDIERKIRYAIISHCFKDNKEYQVYDKEIDTIVSEMLDNSIKAIFPLTEKETYIIRKNLGIFNAGKTEFQKDIAKELNITISEITQTIKRIYYMLRNRAIGRYENQERKKVADIHTITIEQLDLPKRAIYSLKSNGIFTIDDLTKKTRSEVKSIRNIGPKYRNEIAEKLHALGMVFADENYEAITSANTIEYLGLSKATYFLLKRAGIHTIKDLIVKEREEIIKMPNIGAKSEEIFAAINRLGLKFKEEEISKDDLDKKSDAIR